MSPRKPTDERGYGADCQFTAASFLPLLKKGGDNTEGYASQIINTTSISGLLKGSSGGQFAYAASKQSMVQVCRFLWYLYKADVQMTKVMASEFLHLKIRVNQIAVSALPHLPISSSLWTHPSLCQLTHLARNLPIRNDCRYIR
jgi:NAD(P)-dependent dehydrogenase (short-subunit alcohol dehydrogenase family)